MHPQQSGLLFVETMGVHVAMCTYLWVGDALDTLWTLPTTGKVFIYQAFALNLQKDTGKHHCTPHTMSKDDISEN